MMGLLPEAERPLTIPLRNLQQRDVLLAGGKAVNLGLLAAVGLPVPPGFVITTEAFTRFMIHNQISSASLSRNASANSGPVVDSPACANPVPTKQHAPLPGAIESVILNELAKFPDVELWAVRSSATGEDSKEMSFAGLHDTFLNVRKEEVPQRAWACWLSLFTPRAIAYRSYKGISAERLSMAVIVQQMVPSEASGVIFTRDPLIGDDSQMIVEGAQGLGDAIVSGHVEPERITIPREELSQSARKGSGRILDAVRSVEAASNAPTLRRWQEDLRDLALKAERALSPGLDIEWAVSEGRVWLLQARPITTGLWLRSADNKAERDTAGLREQLQIWSNINSGEVAPDAMTPITWSLINRMLEPLFASTLRLVGLDIKKTPLVGLVGGRIYFNVTTAWAAFRPFGFLAQHIPKLAYIFGGDYAVLSPERLAAMPREAFPDLGFRWYRYLWLFPRIAWDLFTHRPSQADAWFAGIIELNRRLAEPPSSNASPEQLVSLFNSSVSAFTAGWDFAHLYSGFAALPVFHAACARWLNDPELTVGYRLFSGLPGMPEREAGIALWDLAALAMPDPGIHRALLNEPGWNGFRGALPGNPASKAFLNAWGAFMLEHGHHCRGELELYNARWRETPDYILGVLRSYLEGLGDSNPRKNLDAATAGRVAATQACLGKLTNPLKRAIFRWSLSSVQKLAVDRERWKSEAVKWLASLRVILLQLGKKLHAEGRLSRADDVFFLEVSELESAVKNQNNGGLLAAIEARRAEFAFNQTLTPPPVVVGKFDPARHHPNGHERPLDVLKGIPVYPGVVQGRARVILRANEHEHVLPGEILVAPFTDPAWTPYFIHARGVAIDQGGILSHGSIIAREYGLPAVTNLRSATASISTGDLIEVDGGSGQVRVISRAGNF